MSYKSGWRIRHRHTSQDLEAGGQVDLEPIGQFVQEFQLERGMSSEGYRHCLCYFGC